MKPRKRPAGRPSLFTTELGDEICNRIADGESLRAICDAADMPDKVTVFRWLLAEEHKDFSNRYIRARDIQADVLFDEIHQIADTPQKGTNLTKSHSSLMFSICYRISSGRTSIGPRSKFKRAI